MYTTTSPQKIEQVAGDVVLTTDYKEATDALAQGKKVLFNPANEKINGVQGKFVQVFWNPVHFPNQPGTMGLLVDPKHPAFEISQPIITRTGNGGIFVKNQRRSIWIVLAQ